MPSSGRSIPGGGSLNMNAGISKFRSGIPVSESSSSFAGLARQQLRDGGKFAGKWGVAWTGYERLETGISDLAMGLTMSGGLEDRLHELGQRMVNWMVFNHNWQNRSFDAEAGLQYGIVKHSETSFSLFVGYGKETTYGIWLEVRWGGKFALLVPTLEHFRPQLARVMIP